MITKNTDGSLTFSGRIAEEMMQQAPGEIFNRFCDLVAEELAKEYLDRIKEGEEPLLKPIEIRDRLVEVVAKQIAELHYKIEIKQPSIEIKQPSTEPK